MNKHSLIQKIKSLDSITQDERAYLINLINTKKKYGLVWEDKPEDVEEQLRENLPVLREVVEKRILAKDLPSQTKKNEIKKIQQSTINFNNSENHSQSNNQLNQSSDNIPNHIIIEGDNLHALTALTFTHEGKIDVMYFDPPYNTGNKDFKYNDSFVDKEDSYRHSKWLSFMEKRLKIAKRLLNEKGVMFISIDDNEQSQLKILCDEILGEQNFIANITVINNLKGRSDDKYIATAHEHLLIYKKGSFETIGIPVPEKYMDEYKLQDERGVYRLQGLRKRGSGALKKDRPKMYYPFFFNKKNNLLSLQNQSDEDVEILPKLSDGNDGRWRWGKETAKERINELVVSYIKNRMEYDIFQKDYLHKESGNLKRIKPKSFWEGSEFSSDSGTKLLKEIIPFVNFNNPKAIELIKFCLIQSSSLTSIILDFFAGSGTTLHSTMELNNEDSGNRQCILITNNENNICEEVTYERNKRVIQGYTNSKGEPVPGLTNNNLRYFKSEFVSREPSLKNKRELTKLATELLCIKEDCYIEQEIKIKQSVLFENDKLFLLILYDDIVIPEVVELIKIWDKSKIIKVYVFSIGSDPYTEDFSEVLDRVELCALPDAIYKAYLNVLPKKKKSIPVIEDDLEAIPDKTEEQLRLI